MRSGIGPAQLLRSLGLSSVADLPAVGRNLQNHPALMLAAHLPRAAIQPASQRCLMQNVLRFSSGHGGCSEHDMLLYPFNRASWHPLGGQNWCARALRQQGVFTRLGRARECGYHSWTRIRFNLLADGRDLERMVDGARLMLELFGIRTLQPSGTRFSFLTMHSPRVSRKRLSPTSRERGQPTHHGHRAPAAPGTR